MNDADFRDLPAIHSAIHSAIEAKSAEIGFTMPSDRYIGSLLKTLMSSKPNGHFLELGTGIGLSLSWMADGLVVPVMHALHALADHQTTRLPTVLREEYQHESMKRTPRA